MIKFTVVPGGYQLARRPSEDRAWCPIDKRDYPLPCELADRINTALLALPKNVTHFVNNVAITFYDGERPVFVSGDVVQSLQRDAEIIEARMLATFGQL